MIYVYYCKFENENRWYYVLSFSLIVIQYVGKVFKLFPDLKFSGEKYLF